MNRKDFKLLDTITYLDSGAGALKPKQVIDAIADFYNNYPINPHSADSTLGIKVQAKVKETRELVADLLDAAPEEIIFTSGTTDSLNRISKMFKAFLKEGDEILLSYYNHASNIVPWLEIAKETGAKVVYTDKLIEGVNEKTKIVAFAQANNTLYQHVDIEKLYKDVKKVGAVLVNDAAQAIMHEDVSLHDADVIVFSGNKLYGPTGIGVLAVRQELLSVLKPSTFGGGALVAINGKEWIAKEGFPAYEAGTFNTAGIVGLGAAVKYFNANWDHDLEVELAEYAFDQLSTVEGIKMYSRRGEANILFNIKEYNGQDVVSYLGHKNIILRAGAHCAKLLKEVVDFPYSIRLSVASYNTKEDIDKAVTAIKGGGDFIDFI